MRKNYLILMTVLLASLVLVFSVNAAPLEKSIDSTSNTESNIALTIFLSENQAKGKLIIKYVPLVDLVKNNPNLLINGINETFKGKATDINLEFDNFDVTATFKLNDFIEKNNSQFTFSLQKINSTLGFSEWAILYFDEFSLKLPKDATLLSLTPAPDRTNNNHFSWDWYNWDTDIILTFSTDTKLSGVSPKIGPKRKSPHINLDEIRKEISSKATKATTSSLEAQSITSEALSINQNSRFAKPGLEVYTGGDVVWGHTAQEWAEKYQHYFIYDVDYPDYGCEAYTDDTTEHPAKYYYRVFEGTDTYRSPQTNSIAIQYFIYYNDQPCPPHKYDYEPVWVWVDSWGAQPYKLVFLDWHATLSAPPWEHFVSVFRRSENDFLPEKDNGKFYPFTDTVENKAWYPFGSETMTHKIRLEAMSSLTFEDTTHFWLRVPHMWHSSSADLDCGWPDSCDEDEEWYCPSEADPFCNDFTSLELTPLSLSDSILKSWYKRFFNRNCGVSGPENMPLMTDVSDPFNHPVFYGRDACDNPPNPTVSITSLTYSISGNNLIATATVLDENLNSIQGLWPDRFYGYLDSAPLTRLSRTETSAGTYELTFDISGKSPRTYTFKLYAYDNLDVYDTATTSVNIAGDTQPPNQPGLSSPANGATVNDDMPTFSWTEPSDPGGSGIASYRIQVDDDSGFGSPEIDKSDIDSASTSYTAPFALPDGKYYWHVLAVDNNGNIGDYSGTWSFTVDTSCVDTSDPPAPSSISVPSSDSDGAYTVSWSSVVDNGCSGISHYELKEQSPSGATRYINTYGNSKGIVVNENGVYTYWARAWDTANNYGGWSPGGSVTVNIPPSDPSVIDGFTEVLNRERLNDEMEARLAEV